MPEEKMKFNPISYSVEVDGMHYRYALHSTKNYRIIFPSQILNVLEYCLFKKIKEGWRGEITQETFPFEVTKLLDGEPMTDEQWPDKATMILAFKTLLDEYYQNIVAKF